MLLSRSFCVQSRTVLPGFFRSSHVHRGINATRDHRQSLPFSSASTKPHGELHAALERLKTDAANYVNLSRLQLALRSLEVSDNQAVIRIAVLGLDSQKSSRQLVKLVLADPLEDAATWETEIEQEQDNGRRGLVIRYGEQPGLSASNSLVNTLHVPSPILQKNNIEILVSSLNIGSSLQGGQHEFEEFRKTAMVPTAETPTSFAGGVQFVTFPVHKAIVLANGLQGFLKLAPLIMNADVNLKDHHDTFRTAVVPDTDVWPTGPGWDGVTTVDVARAAHSLAKLRESVSNSTIYETGWTKSGIQQFSDFILKGIEGSALSMQPVVHDLIRDILEDTTKSVEEAFSSLPTEKAISAEYLEQQQALIQSLAKWAEISHAELQDWLDDAFEARNWAKLRWWKLFWRADDVSMIATEVLERRWLVDSEKNMIWLAGHIDEAGYNLAQSDSSDAIPQDLTLVSPSETKENQIVNDQVTGVAHTPIPWPSEISRARQTLAASTIPALQALAQKLVLEAGTVVSLTTALSALMYVSISTTSIYEAGAVAALGSIWALRRLQKRWETAKTYWQSEIREAGRQVLQRAEDNTRATLLGTDKQEPELDGAQDRAIAMAAIENARDAFRAAGSDSKGS